MNITVLSGSPKGEQSVTLQYTLFLQKKFPQHAFRFRHVAQQINALERDPAAFQAALDDVKSADAVMWAFPLYYMLVHGSYKRFIELIWERQAQSVFAGKYATAISTSVHFYDHTAHNYMQAICDDLDMRYLAGYSAKMNDLTIEAERQNFLRFAEQTFAAITAKQPTVKAYAPISPPTAAYRSATEVRPAQAGNRRIVIVTDRCDEQTNLGQMVSRMKAAFGGKADIVDLSALDMKGGCLGCIRCGYDNTCVWDGKDGHRECYVSRVQPADVLIFAGTMRDRYLSARWKTFFDRTFFRGHTPSLMGKQIGCLISGALRQNQNLREILQAHAELEQCNLTGIVSDESGDAAEIDAQIDRLAAQAIWCAERGYRAPQTFLGLGGHLIFRDMIWGFGRFFFQADHRFYKAHRLYDFPQKDLKARLLHVLGFVVMKIPALRRRFYTKEMIPGMVRGLQKVVAEA